MSEELMRSLDLEFERRARIQPLSQAIRQAVDWRLRLAAISAYYREVDSDILRADPRFWAFDPYEVDWPMLFTPIEAAIWSDIRRLDVALYPQYPVHVLDGRTFYADFGNPVALVAIECDGAAFHDAARDRERDRAMRADGWTVFRFTGAQCRQDFNSETMQRSDVARSLERIARDYFGGATS